MNTFFASTLQEMCFSKIALQIYNDRDIKSCLMDLVRHMRIMKETNLEEDMDITEEIPKFMETRGKELASTLPIPTIMKKPLFDALESLALEIFKWYETHSFFVCTDFDEFSSLCLRSDGTIDCLKTAQTLVERQDANIIVRFRIACHYCLTADMQRLIEESPNICTRAFEALPYFFPWLDYWFKKLPAISPASTETTDLLVQHIENEGQLLYLLQSDNKDLLRRITLKKVANSDVVRVCLPRLDKNDLKILFSDSDVKLNILITLLLYAPYCLDVVKQMWEYLDEFDIYQFFMLVEFWRNGNTLELDFCSHVKYTLANFWNECPSQLKGKVQKPFLVTGI
ncbi:hypothetical protein CDAR_93471 [Caerostris darwini]|uniref:Uncharacterized protein n=1 Tax=Caerostris darwini TaxID=1538125 RepID=A0AAV4Q870_9ARAC|nr:hypothetical protein CDAR_93471 [Caerostris darwini]